MSANNYKTTRVRFRGEVMVVGSRRILTAVVVVVAEWGLDTAVVAVVVMMMKG